MLLVTYYWSSVVSTGQVLDCSLAKPQADQKSSSGANSQKSSLLPGYPHVGYGMVGGTYTAVGAGFGGPGLAQVRILF